MVKHATTSPADPLDQSSTLLTRQGNAHRLTWVLSTASAFRRPTRVPAELTYKKNMCDMCGMQLYGTWLYCILLLRRRSRNLRKRTEFYGVSCAAEMSCRLSPCASLATVMYSTRIGTQKLITWLLTGELCSSYLSLQ